MIVRIRPRHRSNYEECYRARCNLTRGGNTTAQQLGHLGLMGTYNSNGARTKLHGTDRNEDYRSNGNYCELRRGRTLTARQRHAKCCDSRTCRGFRFALFQPEVQARAVRFVSLFNIDLS